MQPFDIHAAPLQGTCLIEAAAGTGKTFTLAAVYLRLVAERGLRPEEILVVTFTTAATAELRERIRRRLAGAREALAQDPAADPVVHGALERGLAPAQLRGRVDAALVNFDRAAIFTIHGFCQRILQEQAFETGNLFDTELIQDQTGLLLQAADDFWRRKTADLPGELVGFLLDRLHGPEALAGLAAVRRTPGTRVLPEPPPPSLPSLGAFRERAAEVCRLWPARREAVAALLRSPALNATVYGSLKADGSDPVDRPRERKIAELTRSLDGLCRAAPFRPPLPEPLERLTRERIARATRKGQTPPADPFFDAWQGFWETAGRLAAEMAVAATGLQADFLKEVGEALASRKAAANVQSFDDLLERVARALEGPGAAALSAAVQARFRAALVDEFQDTDTLQYRIFQRLFGGGEPLFFMIGDPKQAIYSFRGADVFTYLRAARDAGRRFTLSRNWRSAPGLIQAVNALFQGRPHPFRHPEIVFTPAVAGPALSAPPPAAPPFRLWILDGRSGGARGRGMSKSQAQERIAAAVTAEIARLVGAGGDWRPGQVAVLVRTNHQARLLKAHLAGAGLPAVLFNAGNVFDSPESLEVERILAAVAEPADEGRLRAALATDLLGFGAGDLEGRAGPEDPLPAAAERFAGYHALWRREGLTAMFRRLLAVEGGSARLLGLPDGERRLTNVLHLLELLQEEGRNRDPGMRGLVQWLADRREHRVGELEEHQLRLESDAEAVTLVTVHKSKGLEYPVVFCPFGWEAPRVEAGALFFHDPAADFLPVLDLRIPASEDHLALAREEALAESLRLLYVAVTRARERCYLVHAWLPAAAGSPLAFLLDPEDGVPEAWDAAAAYPELALRAAGSLAVEALPSQPAGAARLRESAPSALQARRLTNPLRSDWRVTSYSALTAGEGEGAAEGLDRDPRTPGAPPPATPSDAEPIGPLAEFPAGAGAGLFFHDLLEHLDFGRTTGPALAVEVAAALQTHGFPLHWTAAVAEGLHQVMEADLLGGTGPPLRLRDLAPADRVAEMEFYHPLKRLAPGRLADCFRRHLKAGLHGDLPQRLERLGLHPLEGALKGYIDLVFRRRGRYYLLDWKSNLLGDRLGHYRREALAEVMARELYVLQYHLYTLALDRLLRQRVPGYRYGEHFGGVFYLFLRGMRAGHPEGPGIFRDRPEEALMEELAELLLPPWNPAPSRAEGGAG